MMISHAAAQRRDGEITRRNSSLRLCAAAWEIFLSNWPHPKPIWLKISQLRSSSRSH